VQTATKSVLLWEAAQTTCNETCNITERRYLLCLHCSL